MTARHSRPTVAPLISRDYISRKHARGAALGRRGLGAQPCLSLHVQTGLRLPLAVSMTTLGRRLRS